MDCQRCSGPLEAYTLGGRSAAICQQCGWVGVKASLQGDGERESPESWDEALGRVTERRVSTDRDETTLPDVATGAERAANTGGDDGTERVEALGTTEGDREQEGADDDTADLGAIDGLDSADADRLRGLGVRTVADLASADPRSLADRTGISEADTRAYVRKASVRLATERSGDV
jgi:predicted flap endonuclease-1-like 5' DNA nuclease